MKANLFDTKKYPTNEKPKDTAHLFETSISTLNCELCRKKNISEDNYTTSNDTVVCFDCWCGVNRDFEHNPPKPYFWK